MTRSALPDHLDEQHEIDAAFPDDSENGSFIRKLKKATKHWFAFGPRADEWWARWREWPRTLFALKGKDGYYRIETETLIKDSAKDCLYDARYLLNDDLWHADTSDPHTDVMSPGYLSRQQRYTRWSIQIQWPFMVAIHRYDRAEDVPTYGVPKETDGTLWFFYIGAHRDADKVYWFPSGYIGRNWK